MALASELSLGGKDGNSFGNFLRNGAVNRRTDCSCAPESTPPNSQAYLMVSGRRIRMLIKHGWVGSARKFCNQSMTITEIPHIERSEMNGDRNPENNNHGGELSRNCGHEIHRLVNQNVVKWLGDDGTSGKNTFDLI